MDNRIEVREWNNTTRTRNIPPQMILNLDIDDLNYTGDTITTVLVKKGDKIARINLTIAANNGKVKASVTTDGPDRDTQKTVNAIFGWEQDPRNPKAVEYPKGDERRTTPA